MDLADRIIEALRHRPRQKAAELARTLGASRSDVNALLYGQLSAVVMQVDDHRWQLRPSLSASDTPFAGSLADGHDVNEKHLFARLCNYYLQCIAFDLEADASFYADSKFGDLDYLELDSRPFQLDPSRVESHPRFGAAARARTSDGSLFLGYPTRIRTAQSNRSGWRGRFVEPVLLFPLGRTDAGRLGLLDEPPIISAAVAERLDRPRSGKPIDAVLNLQRDLGLLAPDGLMPDPADVVRALRDQRPEWDWVEQLDPDVAPDGQPLSSLQEQGIYNRAVVVRLELAPYTRGLDTELKRLRTAARLLPRGTALSSWLEGSGATQAGHQDSSQQPLLEPVPLNSEQRTAVRRGLTQPLTIVTGPPGTGKSQVVTSLLVNAAFQGKRVLFASKNNKAVDVVETRVNALAPRPVLLRLGSNQYRSRLADLLTSFLAAAGASEDDAVTLQLTQERHETLTRELTRIERDQQQLVEARNTLDRLDRQVDKVRRELGGEHLRALAAFDIDRPSVAIASAQRALKEANRSGQSLPLRLVWPFIRGKRLRALREAMATCNGAVAPLRLPRSPNTDGVQPDLAAIRAYLELATQRLGLARLTRKYFEAMAELATIPSIETLAVEHLQLIERMAANSEGLWRSWVSVQPRTLTQQDRGMLQNFLTALRLTLQADDDQHAGDAKIRQQVRELYPKVTRILPCWAITSLSAHGRLPLEPAFFDIVVIDEASQCDIASALPLLYRAKSAVIIGDPQQLRHISSLPRARDAQLLEQHELVEDGLRWSYSANSVFDLASSLAEPQSVVQLRDHHRSHADIIEFSNEHFYEGALRVATRYERLVLPARDQPVVKWLNVAGRVRRPPAGGAFNEDEAAAVVKTLRDLLMNLEYRGDIGVVSPFRAQANRIQELVSADEALFARLTRHNFLVNTVHAFQGDERDLMLFSPVVSNGTPQGAIGFLQSNRNLFNVAITRARGGLWVIGDLPAALDSGVDYLAAFAKYVQQLDADRPTSSEVAPGDELGDEYPAVQHPERVSDWERHFYRALRTIGARPLPQYQVENYALDFALFDGDRKLNIEVDGARYHMDWTGELCRRDVIRNQRLIEHGWEVKRFWVSQIRDDLEGCLEWVSSWLEGPSRETVRR